MSVLPNFIYHKKYIFLVWTFRGVFPQWVKFCFLYNACTYEKRFESLNVAQLTKKHYGANLFFTKLAKQSYFCPNNNKSVNNWSNDWKKNLAFHLVGRHTHTHMICVTSLSYWIAPVENHFTSFPTPNDRPTNRPARSIWSAAAGLVNKSYFH